MNGYEYTNPAEQGGLSEFYAQLDSRKAQPAPAPQVAVGTPKLSALEDARQYADNEDYTQQYLAYSMYAAAEALTRIAECLETLVEDKAARDAFAESVALYRPATPDED